MPFIAITVAVMLALGGGIAVTQAEPGSAMYEVKDSVKSALHITTGAEAQVDAQADTKAETSTTTETRHETRVNTEAHLNADAHAGSHVRTESDALLHVEL